MSGDEYALPPIGEESELLEEPSHHVVMVDTDLVKKQSTVTDTTSTKAKWIPCLVLGAAIVSLSSVAPLLNAHQDVETIMKVFWRMNLTSICLIPLAAKELWKRSIYEHLRNVLRMGPAALAYAGMTTFFVVALEYTSIGNAVITSNSQCLLLMVAKIFVGATILPIEAVGALIAFCWSCSVRKRCRFWERK